MRLQRLAIALTLLLVLGGCAILAPPIEVAGTWLGDLAWVPDDPLAGFTEPLTLQLEQTGREFTGTVILQGPSATSILITVDSGSAGRSAMDLHGTGTLTYGDVTRNVELTLMGELDGDDLRGTGTRTIQGESHHFEWTARRTVPPSSP
jgi:hypothetical protein